MPATELMGLTEQELQGAKATGITTYGNVSTIGGGHGISMDSSTNLQTPAQIPSISSNGSSLGK